MLLFSCSKKTEVDSGEVYPMIYTNSWATTMRATKGTEFVVSPLVSPAKADITWTLDEIVLGNDAELRWIPDTLGSFTLTLNVEYNSHKTLRTTLLTIDEPEEIEIDTPFEADPFTPRADKKVPVFGFFDAEEGDTTTINWKGITHLILTTAEFDSEGKIKYPYAQKDIRALVNNAHSHGVYILMQYSGNHNHMTSVQKYGTTNFYDMATGSKSAETVETMMDYCNKNALDGMHIWMDKPTSSSDGYADVAALANFYTALHENKPLTSATGGKFFTTIGTIPSQYVTKGTQDKVVALDGWDYIITMVMCIEATSNTSHAPQDVVKSELQYWQNLNIDKSKLVVTIPAVVWCMDKSAVGGTLTTGNMSAASSYIKFNELFTILTDPASTIVEKNNYASVTTSLGKFDWIRYDGFPWINTKCGYLSSPGAGAMAVWKIDYDGQGDSSMVDFINSKVNN